MVPSACRCASLRYASSTYLPVGEEDGLKRPHQPFASRCTVGSPTKSRPPLSSQSCLRLRAPALPQWIPTRGRFAPIQEGSPAGVRVPIVWCSPSARVGTPGGYGGVAPRCTVRSLPVGPWAAPPRKTTSTNTNQGLPSGWCLPLLGGRRPHYSPMSAFAASPYHTIHCLVAGYAALLH